MSESNVHVLSHPLITHKLNKAREKSTGNADFRRLVSEVSALMCYECTRDLPVEKRQLETPLETMEAEFIDPSKVVFVSILRAGNGILDGMMHVMPEARVGHIGLYRDPHTFTAVEYYFKLPDVKGKHVTVVDPMLATGQTAVVALQRIADLEPASLKFVCLLAAPEGIAMLHDHHPGVPIYTASLERQLNDSKYILPGLGDAGDRLYGTQ